MLLSIIFLNVGCCDNFLNGLFCILSVLYKYQNIYEKQVFYPTNNLDRQNH